MTVYKGIHKVPFSGWNSNLAPAGCFHVDIPKGLPDSYHVQITVVDKNGMGRWMAVTEASKDRLTVQYRQPKLVEISPINNARLAPGIIEIHWVIDTEV